ncbi:hypothetical protein FA95DRAFT_1554009 [Auriscalpium vulgare]|uniref:Uncharacterized protein n=1 Tax=Auriscalpium vulgare TaxID=40419 RepID=A0ACB8S6Q4_9AGAM|nr:hypothetical protein FA95DRAFT_1554009 [Auriscalpium vulgare]
MEHFSWSDTLRALASPCLGCLRASSPHPYLPEYERESGSSALEGLLADSTSSTDDAETLSLHSNIGTPGEHRRKKRRFNKHIRLFGFDLFGRPPIQLPPDDDEAEERRRRREQRRGLSSSTLDSDAAPLDAAVIDSRVDEHAREQEEVAARRARKQERKELRRAARALALQHGGEAFEGFQGSGSGPGGIPSPFLNGGGSLADSESVGSGSVAREGRVGEDVGEDDGDAGDFDAHAYTRRARGAPSERDSDSRSRTSATRSSHSGAAGAEYNHHFLSQPSQSSQPTSPSPLSATFPSPATVKPKKTKSKSSKSSRSRSSKSTSSASASASASLASPVAPQFISMPEPQAQEFEGFPGDMGAMHVVTEGLRAEGAGGFPSGGFPSPRLGGPRGGGKSMGAFLATRG